jgi:subtilisin-like proprotein convertase family protein
LGGKYIIGSKVNSPVFAYDENTGKLQFKDLSNIDLTNIVPSSDGKGLYYFASGYIRFYKMDFTRSAPLYIDQSDYYLIPRISDVIPYLPNWETNQDELPLEYQDEFIDYRPMSSSYGKEHEHTNLNFNASGDLLFVSTSGESGVLVYQRDGLGDLTFSMHITDDDATDEYGDFIINPEPAAVLYSEAMQGVFVSRYANGQSAIAFYQSLEKGVFGSATEINIPVSVSDIEFKVAEIHQGLNDGDLIVRSTTGSYQLLVWDESEQRLKDHGAIMTDRDQFIGVSKVNEVAQFGLRSYTRAEMLVTNPETEEQALEVTYKLFHESVDILKDQCLFFSSSLNECMNYGDVPLSTWSGSGVMMPNGLHRYYFEKRMEQNGILGYFVDFEGPGRPDRDGDGVEDLFDDFVLDPTEWVDTDGDGIGNNADDDDDNDGLSDVWETQNCRKEAGQSNCDSDNPLFHPLIAELQENSDYDRDGLTNIEEVLLGTDPRKKDTDGDLIWDSWEFIVESDPMVFDSNLDPDLDGYTNLREYQLGTPIYLNTFKDRSASLIETYSAQDITDSGLGMPSLSEQTIIELAADGESVIVADISGIHYFTKDKSARFSYWQTENLGAVQSLSLKFNSAGSRLFVFYTNELGAYRRSYEVNSSNAMINLVEEVAIEAWDGVTEKGQYEYGARYIANKIYTTNDGNFVYIQAENLGLLRYKQRSDGTLEFEGYENGFESLTQSAALSSDFDQSIFYQLNASKLQIYNRDQATGIISIDRTIENSDLTGDLIKEIKVTADSELLLVSPEQISSVVISYQNTSHDIVSAPGGLLETNRDLANMRYILSKGELTALYDNGQDSPLLYQLPINHQGVAVTPVSSDLERRGNYLFVITVDDTDSRRLMVYEGEIKGNDIVDSDNDGIPDKDDALPYNPNESKDGDGDGCGDEFEDKFLGDIDRCLDTDNDGLSNEVDDPDDDNDGLADEFEDTYASGSLADCELSTLSSIVSNDVSIDIDGDGLNYLAENNAGTNPCNDDSDGDTILDGVDELPLSFSFPPKITLLGDPLIEVERGLKLRSLEDEGFVDPYAKASDSRYGTINVGRVITVNEEEVSQGIQFDYSNVDFNNVGLYEAVYTITLDPVEGQTTTLTASVSRQIQVVDTLAPTIIMRDGSTLSVEAGPNYETWPEFMAYSRNIDPDFAKVFIEEKHNSDLPLETTITYRGVETNVTDWSQFSATLDVDDTANYCEGQESLTLEYDCMYIQHSAIDIYGHVSSMVDIFSNASGIRRVVKIYPKEAPEFKLQDMPVCEAGDDSCVASQIKVAVDNAFVARLPDKFDEEGEEIVQTWSLLNKITARDNVDGAQHVKISATVIGYESNDPSTIAILDSTSYGSGHVQYRGPASTNYYIEDKAGNRSELNKLDRYLSIGDQMAPMIRLCGNSRLFLEEGAIYNPLDYPQYEAQDLKDRYQECDNRKIEFFAEDASDGYLKLCEDGQTDLCVALTTNIGFDPDNLTLGVHTITYTAMDSSPNSPDSSVTRYIEVLPTEVPTITMLGANPLLWNQGSTYIDPGATLADNADGKLTLIVEDDSVNVRVSGEYEVSLSGQDSVGNISQTLTRVVQVKDISSPYIKLLGDNPSYVVKGDAYKDDGATVGDNVGVTSFNTLGLESIDTTTSGTYQITYQAQDAAGNETIDYRDVVVGPEDTQPPTISMIDDRVSYNNGVYLINHNQGQAFSVVLVEAIDDQQGNITHLVDRDGSIDINVPGTYDQTIYVRDFAGNRSIEFLVRVSVRDNEAPSITLNGDEHIFADPIEKLFIDPQGIATDNIDGDIDWSDVNVSIEFDDGEQILVVENVDLEQVGKYILTYSVTDSSGNSTQVNRYVYALHPQKPFLNLIGGSPVYVEQNSDFSDPGVSVFDKQDDFLGIDNVEISGSIDTSTPGDYPRTYSVEDTDGNRVTVSRTFIVADSLEPLLTLIGASELTIECGIPAADPGASAHDLVDGDISSQILVNGVLLADNTSLDTNTERFIKRTYEVTDSTGNDTAISRDVTVEDRSAPEIQLGESSPMYVEAGLQFINPIPVITDLCSQGLAYTVSGTVNTDVIETYQLSYNAVDEKGIAAEEVILEIIVADTLPPNLIVNPELYIEHEMGVTYVDPGASAHDQHEGNVTNGIIVLGSVNENVAETYELNYSVSDSSGNSSPSITRTVVVADRIAPVISLNGLEAIDHEQGTTYTDAGASASDSFDGNVTDSVVVTSNVDSQIADVYTITYNVSDAAGNAATPVVRTVTVSDTIAPAITLTGEVLVNVEQGTSYIEAGASAIDTVDGDVSANILIGGDTVDPNMGGTYIVTYNVSDEAGNPAIQVTRSVIVEDTIAPVITLNGSASINHEQATPYIDAGATANDSFDGDVTASIVVTNIVDSQGQDVYTVTYNVNDAAGNAATPIVRTVTVTDTTAPLISLTGDSVVNVEQGTSYIEAGASATDTVDGAVSARILIGGDAIYSNIAGTYIVTYNVSDEAGNPAIQVTRSVIVEDTIAPVITLNGPASIDHEQATPYVDAGASATDSFDGDVTTSIVVTNIVDSQVQDVYTVTYNVNDAAGNAATPIVRTVTVTDTTAPLISLTGDPVVNVEQGTSYIEAGASATDTVDGDVSARILIGGDTVDPNMAGTYIVTYNVSDEAGNPAIQVTRSVIVEDTIAPEITLNGSININHEQATPYVDAGATANDNFDGDVTASIVVTNIVNSQGQGAYTVTYNAFDAAGNAATPIVRTVTVRDSTAPLISLTGDPVVNVEQGTSYIEAGASANDTVDGDVSARILIGGDTVYSNIAGTYIVTYNVSDEVGNAAVQVARAVIVADTIAPVIALNGPASINHEQATPYADAGATANDSFNGDVTASIIVTNIVNSQGQGVYTVTYNAFDAAGNVATPIVRTVTVTDTTAPLILLMGDPVVNVEQGTSYIEAGASANDTVDGDVSANILIGGDTVYSNIAGTYIVTYNVSDSAVNAALTVTREVNVIDSNKTYSSSPALAVGSTSVSTEINVNGDLIINDLNVFVDMPHAWVGDVIATLTSPAGTSVQLIDQPGKPTVNSSWGCSSKNFNVTLDDEGTANVESTCTNSIGVSGTLIPNNALNAFDGESSLGVWTLRIDDAYPSADHGTLNTWRLEFNAE